MTKQCTPLLTFVIRNADIVCVLTLSASSDTVFKVECSVTARRIHSISIVVENKHFILQHYVNDNVKDETQKIKINTKSKHKIPKLITYVGFH